MNGAFQHLMWVMEQKGRMTVLRVGIFVAAVALFFVSVRPALAHTRVEIGPYVIILGWLNEPPIVGERNSLILDISKDGAPVEGVEGSLDLSMLYGGRTFIGNVSPTETPGIYTAEILPTVRGQYLVELSGAIEDLAVSEQVEPEEVLPAAVLQFPESPPEPGEIQSSVDELQSELQTTRILAIVAVGFGLVALVVAVLAIVRGRQ
jgi:hypothetical protein